MTYLLAQASAHRIPLRDESVQTCVTSPPYWGLRAYAGEQSFVWGGDEGHAHEWGELGRAHHPGQVPDGKHQHEDAAARGQNAGSGQHCPCGAWRGALGLEPTPDMFVAHMVEVFREVRRVLRKDGTLWLNLGDSYAGSWGAQSREHAGKHAPNVSALSANQVKAAQRRESHTSSIPPGSGLKPKDLVGIPWRVAFALQADGWYLRSDIVWAKPNPMPESVTDRPTKSHEYLFLMSKEPRYFYDADAIREAVQQSSLDRVAQNGGNPTFDGARARREAGHISGRDTMRPDQLVPANGRNARSVWNIATQPYPGAHFATFPEELPERCIKAGSAAQACSVCGASWERVTERVDQGWDGSRYGERIVDASGGALGGGTARSTLGSSNGRLTGSRSTLGFEPTCAHDVPTVGSVVLDPFNGSGTTGRVAMRLGRRYVGLDLSREYLSEQAIARIDPIAAAARDFRDGVDQSQGVLL